jgi:hypothetical protein
MSTLPQLRNSILENRLNISANNNKFSLPFNGTTNKISSNMYNLYAELKKNGKASHRK